MLELRLRGPTDVTWVASRLSCDQDSAGEGYYRPGLLARGEATLFSAYGATDPAEFFAVVSEVFFEQPQRMAAGHPALYAELRGLYRVDPLSW